MPRPQFSIRTLLWLTLVVAAFLGGIGFDRQWQKQKPPIAIKIRVFDPANPSVPIESPWPGY
jgi:hypothetical protein